MLSNATDNHDGPMAHGSRYTVVQVLWDLLHLTVYSKVKTLQDVWVDDRVTIQNLEVVQVVPEKNVILIKGNVPGAKKSLITIKSAVLEL